MLVDNISTSWFVFSRSRKNVRVLSDTCKLTNSEILYYGKDSDEEVMRFYYELYHLLGATYYADVRM